MTLVIDLIKANYRLPKTNRSYMHIFSIGLEFAFFKFFEKNFFTQNFKGNQF